MIVEVHVVAEISAVAADGQLVSISFAVHLKMGVLGGLGDSVPSCDPEQSLYTSFRELMNLVQSWNCGSNTFIRDKVESRTASAAKVG